MADLIPQTAWPFGAHQEAEPISAHEEKRGADKPLPVGPWKFVAFGFGYRIHNGETCSYGLKAIAETDNKKVAHLLAAAPDLYEALRSLLPTIETRLTSNKRDAEAWQIVAIARAALAKAEGA